MTQNFGSAMLDAIEHVQCRADSITFDIVDLHERKHSPAAQSAVRELQKIGFRIGIGEFGMTSSDIDLLKVFKPDEVFLAKSFSGELLGSTSNQIFADGALRIASANNVVSTADGIDDRDVLKELTRRGCDRGKGKIISMPMNYKDFIDTHFPENDKMAG